MLNRWRADLDLFRLAKAGNRLATQELVKRLSPRALSLAHGMLGNSGDAEDIVQDSFIKLFAQESYAGQAQLASYFYQIVSRTAIDYLRVRRLLDDIDEHDDLAVEDDNLPENLDAGILKRAIEQLKPQHRMALILWAYQDASMSEIAHALDLDVNAAKQLVHRAKLALKRMLERMGYEG